MSCLVASPILAPKTFFSNPRYMTFVCGRMGTRLGGSAARRDTPPSARTARPPRRPAPTTRASPHRSKDSPTRSTGPNISVCVCACLVVPLEGQMTARVVTRRGEGRTVMEFVVAPQVPGAGHPCVVAEPRLHVSAEPVQLHPRLAPAHHRGVHRVLQRSRLLHGEGLLAAHTFGLVSQIC